MKEILNGQPLERDALNGLEEDGDWAMVDAILEI